MNQPIVPYIDEETGFLYIADYSNNRVQIFDKDTGVYIRQIGGGGAGGDMTGLGADALNGPRGICIDGPSGLLFIADREVQMIIFYVIFILGSWPYSLCHNLSFLLYVLFIYTVTN